MYLGGREERGWGEGGEGGRGPLEEKIKDEERVSSGIIEELRK